MPLDASISPAHPPHGLLPVFRPFAVRRQTMTQMMDVQGGPCDAEDETVSIREPTPKPRAPQEASWSLPLPTRRFLSVAEAAGYVGVSATTFLDEVRDGRWPPPVRRGKTGRATTWDVRALDAAADRVSQIVTPHHQASEALAKKNAEAAALARFK